MLSLTQFCGEEESCPYLAVPWSIGAYTYATNGHIIVRVDRREEYGENADNPITAEKAERVLAPEAGDAWHRAKITLPELVISECEECGGMGSGIHDCRTCMCECFECYGTGEASSDRRKSAIYKGVPFALKYVRQIAALPDLELAGHATGSRLRFRFDGGIGSVMGLVKSTSDVVDAFSEGADLQKEASDDR